MGSLLVGLLVALAVWPRRLTAARPPQNVAKGYGEVKAYAEELGRRMQWTKPTREWFVRFALVQAWSESRGSSAAKNTSTAERIASKRLFDARSNEQKLIDRFDTLGTRSEWYTPGSGGWFGLMPTTAVNFPGVGAAMRRAGSRWNYDPWFSTVGMLEYARALMRRANWSQSSRDSNALKIGFAAGSLMDNPENERAQKAMSNLERASDALGIPSSFASQKVPSEIKSGAVTAKMLTEHNVEPGKAAA